MLMGILFAIILIAHLALIKIARGKFLSTMTSTHSAPFTTRMVELSSSFSQPKKLAISMPAPSRPPEQELVKRLPVPETITAATATATATTATATATATASKSSANLLPASPETGALAAPSDATPPEPQATLSAPIAISSSSDASVQPPAFVALNTGLHTYKVTFTKNGITNEGQAQILWQQDGEKYALNMLATYTLLIKTFNVFEQNSTGLVTAHGLQPLRFSDKRHNKSEVAAHFDYLAEKITFSTNKPEVSLLAGAQDRVSLLWQLAGLLAAQPTRYPEGSKLIVQTVSSSDAESWLFTMNEPGMLHLPNGSQIALRLTRNPRREFDQTIELWFAPGLNYLPARFRFTETNGDYVDAIWQSVQQPKPTL